MAMFDPHYVTEVLDDILGRRGLSVSLVLKTETADRQGGENVAAAECNRQQSAESA